MLPYGFVNRRYKSHNAAVSGPVIEKVGKGACNDDK